MNLSFLKPISDAIDNHPLQTKWLLGPSLRIANQWKDQVNLQGISTVNLHSITLRSIVFDVVQSELAERGVVAADSLRCSQVVAKVLDAAIAQGRLKYFSQVRSPITLVPLLTQMIADLRLSGIDSAQLTGAGLESSKKADDLELLYREFLDHMNRQRLIDYAGCVELGKKTMADSTDSLPVDLVLVQPMLLSTTPSEKAFLVVLKQKASHDYSPESVDSTGGKLKSHFACSSGVSNEVQWVLRSCLSELKPELAVRSASTIKPSKSSDSVKLDCVELLHTEYATYVPLIYEKLVLLLGESDVDRLPVTFAEGIACVYSRPGRALRSWIRWCRTDFMQTSLTKMLREGLLKVPTEDEAVMGHALLSHRLRELAIGFGIDRYLPAIEQEVANAKAKQQGRRAKMDRTYEDFSDDYDFGLASYQQLYSLVAELVRQSPSEKVAPKQLLTLARNFLKQHARIVNKLDGYAQSKLINDIDGMIEVVDESPQSFVDVWDWLENLPITSRVLASGPRAGCLHVEHIARGGHSGRQHTFMIGMDDARFPLRFPQDPLLLDFERRKLSKELSTATERNHQSQSDYWGLLKRLRGKVSFCYSVKSLGDDREQFPSSLLLDSFRQLRSEPDVTMPDFVARLGVPESFCPSDDRYLSTDQWMHRQLLETQSIDKRNRDVESQYQHLANGRFATEQIASESFTQFDGNVSEAAAALNPTAENASRNSPSRLETYGTCPRKFFFRYGLGVYPPVEQEVNDQQWLDALNAGSLLHKVFEDFLRELTAQNLTPVYERDLARLSHILEREMELYRQTIPIPNQDVYVRQKQQLEKTCDIFLREEERYCQEQQARPWILEASIGLNDAPVSQVDCTEPISLVLSNGRRLPLGGRIDRIDRLGGEDSLQFAIWDYKTGSNFGFSQEDPFKQGRKLQHFLYVGMLRHRLKSVVDQKAKVQYFGYFFPSPRTSGQRLQWTSTQLEAGEEIVTAICDSIANGVFLATTDKSDCSFCDYQAICRSPDWVAANSVMKLTAHPCDQLQPLSELRQVDVESGD